MTQKQKLYISFLAGKIPMNAWSKMRSGSFQMKILLQRSIL